MIPSGMQVRYLAAFCKACGCAFTMPVLGALSYGEFIFHGRGVHAYLNAIAEPTWDDVVGRLRAKYLLPENCSSDETARLRGTVAMLADRIGGQSLFDHPVCPHCNSHDVEYGGSAAGKFRELPAVTFNAYRALTNERRDADVAAAWNKAVLRPSNEDDLFEKIRAIGAIFSVFKMFHFTSESDIRLGSHARLFEDGAATRAEIEWAIEFMLEKRWLVENDQSGVRPGGHRLTLAGVAAMNQLPVAELKGARLERREIRPLRRVVLAAFAIWKSLGH